MLNKGWGSWAMNDIARNYEDALFRLVIHEAVKEKSRSYMAEAASAEVIIRAETDQRARKLIGRKLHRLHFDHVGRGSLRFFSRAVLVIAVIFTLTFGITMSVDALRADFTRFLLTFYPDSTRIELIREETDGSLIEGGQTLRITNKYVPTYIPDGFTLHSIAMTDLDLDLYYLNEEGGMISFSEYGSGMSTHIDTENAEIVKTVDISGHPGILAYEQGMTTVSWQAGEVYFVLFAHLDMDETLEIARSVILLK